MTDAVPRSVVEAYYRAYAARDAKAVADFLDDDVEWTITRFRDVKVIANVSLLDSYDAVEQVLGYPLTCSENPEGDRIAV